MKMSSLPQGWHNVSDSKKGSTGNSSAASSSVTTVRKKWNSPQSSAIAKSRLPSYKQPTSSLPNGYRNHVRGIPATKSSAETSSTSQSRPSICPAKTPTRDYQNEINNLKKELTSVKAENSILKVKVRRVDDENNQKLRQIEKLRAELKGLQNNNSLSNKRNKEPESLILLRQKCLRLEAALEDKEAALKKLTNNLKTMELEDLKDFVESFQKEVINGDLKDNKLIRCSSSKSQTSTSTRTSLSRVSLSSKSEVTRLRDMLHKLQNENRELQQQTKEKELEIRRLKVQLQRPSLKDIRKSSTLVPNQKQSLQGVNSETKASVKAKQAPMSNHLPLVNQKPSTKSNITLNSKLPKSNQDIVKPIPKKQPSALNRTFQKGDVQANRVASKVSQGILPKPQVKAQKNSSKLRSQKLPMTKASSTFVVAKHILPKGNSATTNVIDRVSMEADVEASVQEMRENIAARKIQRSWRSHQKLMMDKSNPQMENKAIKFIATALRHNKKRKEKLKLLTSKDCPLQLNEEEQAIVAQAVREKHKSIWESELNITF